jgi:acetyl esterase/lipase
MLRNIIVILTLLLVALLPFVTKEHDSDDPTGIRIVHDLQYFDGSKDPRQQLDLYLPRVKPNEKLPLVVWIHGGAWKMGSKDEGPAIALADHGFAVASINYRYSTKSIFPAQIYDCKAAIRWLRAHAAEYSYDATKIGVWGASAGGHLAALLGTSGGVASLEGDGGNADQSSAVQAVSDWCGPTDLESFIQEAMQPRFRESKPELFVNELLGGTPESKKDLAKSASPISFVTSDDPPFLIIHSIEDPVVPFEQSNDFAKKLEAEGVKVKLVKINSTDHMPMTEANFNEVYKFFDETLKPTLLGPQP